MRRLFVLGVNTVLLFTCFGAYTQTPDVDLKERLKRHVYILASDSLEGRAAGTAGGRRAAEYVAGQFRQIGLEPLDESVYEYMAGRLELIGMERPAADTSYMLTFGTVRGNGVRNVIGILRGNDPALRNEAIIIGAHYDHLGKKGKSIYHGADDNASGTATLIEVARMMKERETDLKRTVIFAAFDAEELGLYGSKALAGTMTNSDVFPDPKLMVSMDMVGWLHKGGALKIAGVAMIDGGMKIMEELDTPQGLDVKLRRFDKMIMGGSDHDSFAEEGVPALYMTTGLKSPYHKPQDTVEKIDYDGMALIAEYMAGFTGEFATRDNVGSSGRISFKHKGQRKFEVGLTAAIGDNKHHYRKGALTGKWAFAWNAGVYMQANIGQFAVRPKVVYEDRKALVPDVNGDMLKDAKDFSMQSVTVPVDIMLKSSSSSGVYGYIFVGGYYSRILGGRFPGNAYVLGSGVRRHEWGWQCGLGGMMYKFTVELTVRYGLTPVYEKSIEPVILNRSAYFTVGYKF